MTTPLSPRDRDSFGVTAEKHCKGCERYLPLDAFGKRKAAPDGLKYTCRECDAAYQKDYQAQEHVKEKNREYHRKWHLERTYGVTAEQYAEMLFLQGGRCAACPSDGDGKKLHLDHNHVTGEVRGLLCWCCNAAIGLLKEDVVRMRNLIAYLERGGHGSTSESSG